MGGPRNALLGARKDLVAADAEPFDVRLAGLDLGAVAEGGAAVARVRHLPDVPGPVHALDAQRAGWLAARPECIDKFADRLSERSILLSRQARELTGEARPNLEGRARQSAC